MEIYYIQNNFSSAIVFDKCLYKESLPITIPYIILCVCVKIKNSNSSNRELDKLINWWIIHFRNTFLKLALFSDYIKWPFIKYSPISTELDPA